MTFAICSNVITATLNPKFSRKLAEFNKTKRGPNLAPRRDKLMQLEIMIDNEKYDIEWVIDDIRDLDAEEYDNSTEEDKKEWVKSAFKELVIREIDRLLK